MPDLPEIKLNKKASDWYKNTADGNKQEQIMRLRFREFIRELINPISELDTIEEMAQYIEASEQELFNALYAFNPSMDDIAEKIT